MYYKRKIEKMYGKQLEIFENKIKEKGQLSIFEGIEYNVIKNEIEESKIEQKPQDLYKQQELFKKYKQLNLF